MLDAIPSAARGELERKLGLDLLPPSSALDRVVDELIIGKLPPVVTPKFHGLPVAGYHNCPLSPNGSVNWVWLFGRMCFPYRNFLDLDTSQMDDLGLLVIAERKRVNDELLEFFARTNIKRKTDDRGRVKLEHPDDEREYERHLSEVYRTSSERLIGEVQNIFTPEQMRMIRTFAGEAMFWCNPAQLERVFDCDELGISPEKQAELIRLVSKLKTQTQLEIDDQAAKEWERILGAMSQEMREKSERETNLALFRK